MKTTGLVRRIDDLGRIVIPKEIRKNLRIKDGESLEIFLDRDNIILKKYSMLEGLEDFYKNYVESVQSFIKENVMIVDNDKFVAVAGDLKKKYLNVNISKYIENVINKRQEVVIKDKSDFELSDGVYESCCYVISPIIASGDAIGAFIIVTKGHKMDGFYTKTASIAAKFLGKYIE